MRVGEGVRAEAGRREAWASESSARGRFPARSAPAVELHAGDRQLERRSEIGDVALEFGADRAPALRQELQSLIECAWGVQSRLSWRRVGMSARVPSGQSWLG